MSCFQESRHTIRQASMLTTSIGPALQYTTLLEHAAQCTINAFLVWRADALGMYIMLELGDLSTRAQWFGEGAAPWRGRGGTECGNMHEFVPLDDTLFCKVFNVGTLVPLGLVQLVPACWDEDEQPVDNPLIQCQ
ncbi:hypothetical protein BC826DRAFT_973591 [Russula brevipes]|nr:hypothetical protein BC826DRAFT_973591 [Russula brevipes]